MSHKESWLALLAPLPAEGGEWKQETRADPALAGWTQVRLVLGDGVTGLRVLTAMFEPEGRPGPPYFVGAISALRRGTPLPNFLVNSALAAPYSSTTATRVISKNSSR